ncbi:ead/Ea22-like family protein [Salmonella enterica]|nr:ead/Ea22-like family protein [Salmonella enterica]EAT7587580.1 ead/Ea22-like family protein [Salmonella enterica]EBG8582772.1 ead/Ea22-like family protein [Salmonella enterica]ECT4778046.1 ead/Ea22-like family protein [Salmonella enterica]ECZ1371662.1 ead/Ea22-like family protein [Salmonella enterica]
MTIDKRALREVAEKATPGTWRRTSSLFNGITVTPFSLCGEEVTLAHTVEKRDAEFIAAANPATMLALLDENIQLQREKDATEAVALAMRDDMRQAREQLEAAERSMAEQSAIVAAAEKLVRCKGRYHSELNYRALAKLFGVITPDLPPLVHENVHYAEAVEVEISALRQRIQELEAREVTLPAEKFCPSEYAGSQYWEETEVWNKAISACAVAVRAAGIKVKES